jgi:hypothetical protein
MKPVNLSGTNGTASENSSLDIQPQSRNNDAISAARANPERLIAEALKRLPLRSPDIANRDAAEGPVDVVERLARSIEGASARLYQTHNIIGSTQAAGQRPTVYYRTNSGTFGHITQEHSVPSNIGRELPRKDERYNFGNTGPKGALEEKIGAETFHRSRNPLMPAATQEERQILSTAQEAFRDIKSRYQGGT